ncbi:starch-binding protein [Nostoc linckia z16]|nr:starch-binding protein [Nostoc linckia z16]
MKNFFNSLYLAAVLVSCSMFIFGCDDFVDTDRPNSQLTTGAVFEDATTANAAMTDIYAQMRENGLINGKTFGFSSLLGVYSDELDSYDSGGNGTTDFYNNAVLASNSLVHSLWNSSYNHIYAANLVFEGVSNSSALGENDKRLLQGEALFVRAFTHFNLTNIFGDVPYVTTTDFETNRVIPRTPSEIVMENIIADLETAAGLLPENYVSADRTRPNKATAQALLARVYLYNQQYAEAADTASAVINNEGLYIWENNLDNIFLKESTTTIWQLAPGSQGANTYEGATFIFHAGPPERVALSESILSGFEVGDLRRSHWVREVTDGVTSWFHPYKYKQDIAMGSSMEYSIQLRLAEQYLIRSEARARQGDLIGAKEDLDKIRITAGLSGTAAASQAELLEAVLRERQNELLSENGHHFFDLKRFGRLDQELSFKPGWDSTDILWPIPQTELLVNPALAPQNPGY